jgi:predicted glycogen debranching enzyme
VSASDQSRARRTSPKRTIPLQAALSRSGFASTAGALEREWLVTNALGGFACGSVAQANTRRYHGVLIASLRPPVQRVLMVAKLEPTVRYRGEDFHLGCSEFADGTLAPRGCERLSAFHLENGLPVWTYALADALLEERIWMADGRNTSYVRFKLDAASAPADLELLPLCTYRDYHSQTRGGWELTLEPEEHGCRLTAFAGAQPYRLLTDRGQFELSTDWYWNFYHRIEAERGLDAREDLFRPGLFRARLQPGETLTFIATAEAASPDTSATALKHECLRRHARVHAAPAEAPPWIRWLTLAADQFIVRRTGADGTPDGTTVIAGYPWFSDWGRDTMIALPGLALATGRMADAAAILRTFATYVSEGMLPNRFPDNGETAEYNTVDATLWYFHALASYLEATRDRPLLRELYPTLRGIIDWHRRGTRHAIHIDPEDGLLFAGEPRVQLTWMDAKVGDWVVTPRIGKAVEVNALWHYALFSMAKWARTLRDTSAARDYDERARRVAAAFADAFWFEGGRYLYDVVGGPEGTLDARGRRVDASLRPNQIFAVSLGTDLLDAQRARAVVDICAQELLTPVGLRSLSPRDPRYAAEYRGGPRERDGAYHQGTVWTWLLGPFALAHHRVYGERAHAQALLAGLAPHLNDACIGSISEIMDGDAPHAPRGCFAQAWSVAETLRAWHALSRSPAASASLPKQPTRP